MIRKNIYLLLLCLVAATWMMSCSDDETYAEQKDKERKAVNSFLKRNVTILGTEGDTVCKVGSIKVISEEQFYMQDSMTNVEKNEYVLFGSSGVYMQIVRKGPGKKLESGETKRVLARYLEYNILGDSLQTSNMYPYWIMNPEIMDVEMNSGTITASFNTSVNGGGAMYLIYKSTVVPSGWITPMKFINMGRQKAADEDIAKVRVIVPHSEGHDDAKKNVYPCFYELTYQEMRD